MVGNMQEEFVQAVLTVHTCILTWDSGQLSYMLHIIYTYSRMCMYVCMYVQSTLPVQIGITGSIYIGSYYIILTVLCGIPMYNIVWAMLTIWDNWFLN